MHLPASTTTSLGPSENARSPRHLDPVASNSPAHTCLDLQVNYHNGIDKHVDHNTGLRGSGPRLDPDLLSHFLLELPWAGQAARRDAGVAIDGVCNLFQGMMIALQLHMNKHESQYLSVGSTTWCPPMPTLCAMLRANTFTSSFSSLVEARTSTTSTCDLLVVIHLGM